jgi:hypothetical protein
MKLTHHTNEQRQSTLRTTRSVLIATAGALLVAACTSPVALWPQVQPTPKNVTEIAAAGGMDKLECPDWRRPMIGDESNVLSSNFGCANASNLMQMVADPQDLVQGRNTGPANGDREADAVNRYLNDDVKPLPSLSTTGIYSNSGR